jgi:RNA polymerase sigma-70 factor (ECF subfamily)
MGSAVDANPHRSGPQAVEAQAEGSAALDELLRRTARGDEAAFAQIYDLTAPRVYGLALRVLRGPALAEEVAQEAPVEIWRTASRSTPTADRLSLECSG